MQAHAKSRIGNAPFDIASLLPDRDAVNRTTLAANRCAAYLLVMETQSLPSAQDSDIAFLAEQIVHLARLAHGGGDTGLTPAQWTALRYFSRANRFSRTPSAFSEFHATTRGTASQTVKSLIALGLLERRANEADGRSALIEVTAEGHARLARDPLADLSACIAALPGPMRSTLTQSLGALTTAMARTRSAPVFGPCDGCNHCDTTRPGPAYCRCTQSLLDGSEMNALCADFSPRSVPRLG